MKKFLFSTLLIIAPLLIFSQVWTGGGADDNWSNALNWDSGVVPNATSAQVFLASTAASDAIIDITLDMDAVIGQIKINNAGSTNVNYKINDDGNGRTLTIGGGTPPTEIIQISKSNSDLYFNVNVTINGGNNPQVIKNYAPGWYYFGAGKTLTLNENLKIVGANNKKANVVFSGTNVMSNTAKTIKLRKYGSLTWETTYNGAGFLGNVSIGDASAPSDSAGNAATIKAKLEAKNFYIEAGAVVTIAETGSVVLSGAASVKETGASGHFLLKSSKTSSAALIAPNTTSDVRVRFRKNMDATQIGSSAREWNLVGVPLTGEEIDDVHLLNNQLVAGTGAQAGKTSLARWLTSTDEYQYQSATDDGTGANDLIGGRGYAISPAADGDVEFRGYFQEAAVNRGVFDGDGT